MKEVSHKKLYVRNPDTGKFEPLDAIVGESAYEIAVRLGTFTGTEEEWNNALEAERAAAVASIEAKGAATLDTIPDDYTELQEQVDKIIEQPVIFSGVTPANISTTDYTLTFYKYTAFLGNGFEYEISDDSITVQLFTPDNTVLSIVLLNKSTKEFHVIDRVTLRNGFDLTDYLYVCCVKTYSGYGIVSMDWGLPYTVNGSLVIVEEYTNTAKPLANMLASYSGKFIKIDSVNKTVTFPQDMGILCDNQWGYKYIGGAETHTQEHIVSYADIDSSAVAIYFNNDDGQLYAMLYNALVPKSYMLLMVIRTTTGMVSTNLPYLWDGKLFNTIPVDESGQFVSNAVETSFVKGIAHRGLSSVAPENTISAYRAAVNAGFKYAECDVKFTSDGVAVLLHDGTIDRTSNGTGELSSFTLEEVRAFDFGSWFGESFAGEKIPTFEEFIVFCRNNGLHPYIELKTSSESVENLVKTVHHYGMAKNCTWISFYISPLQTVKNTDPHARLGYVVEGVDTDKFNAIKDDVLGLKTDFNEVFLDICGYTDEGLAEALENLLPIEMWTINTESTIENLPSCVSGVTSDNLDASKILS